MIAGRFGGASRIERQAYRWVARMIDDPQRHEAGLLRWIGQDTDRLAIYNRAAGAMKVATWSAGELYERREHRPAKRFAHFESRWAVAAFLMGVAAACIAIAHIFGSPGQRGLIIPPAEAFEAPVGSPRSVQLSDGSKVDLRPGSHIDTRFSRLERRIILTRGSAQFRVAHLSSWPFVVSAGGGSVTAKGTVFDVTIGQDVSIRLLEGAIDVALPRRLKEGKPDNGRPDIRHLTAGEAMRYPLTQLTGKTPALARDDGSQDRFAMKSFDDVPVRDVIAEINRHAASRIELSDPAIGDRRIVLDLHIGDTDDVAEGLAAYLGLDVDRSQPGILLLRPTR